MRPLVYDHGADRHAHARGRVIAVISGQPRVGVSSIVELITRTVRQRGRSVASFEVGGRIAANPHWPVLRRTAEFVRDARGQFDLALLDGGCVPPGRVADIHALCDQLLVAVTPEPQSIVGAYLSTKQLTSTQHPGQIAILVNRSTAEQARRVSVRFIQTAHHFLRQVVSYAGYLPTDHNLSELGHERSDLNRHAADNGASHCWESLCDFVDPPKGKPFSHLSLWSRVASLIL